MQPRRLSTFVMRAHSWLMVNLLSPGCPDAFLQSCFPADQLSAFPAVWGYSSPGALLNLTKFLLTHSSSLSVHGSTNVWCISLSSWFCIVCKFAVSCPLMEVLVLNCWTLYQYWGKPLAAVFQLDFIWLIVTFWAQQSRWLSAHLTVHISTLCFIRFQRRHYRRESFPFWGKETSTFERCQHRLHHGYLSIIVIVFLWKLGC